MNAKGITRIGGMGRVAIALGALMIAAAATDAHAQTAYDLFLLPTGSKQAKGVNIQGHVLYAPSDGTAAIWAKTGTISIPPLEVGKTISAESLDSDDTVVGSASITSINPFPARPDAHPESAAIIWDPLNGTRDLNERDTAGNLTHPEWYLTTAYGIRGRYVIGSAMKLDPSDASLRGVTFRLDLWAREVVEVPGSRIHWVGAVNASGEVIFAAGPSGPSYWDGVSTSSLPLAIENPNDLSDTGHIAACHYFGSYMRACYLDSPTAPVKTLGTLSGGAWQYSHGWGVNNSGAVVGGSTAGGDYADPIWHAFRWKPGDTKLTDLDKFKPKGMKWVLRSASKINDNGWIVGEAKNGSATTVFVLIPK